MKKPLKKAKKPLTKLQIAQLITYADHHRWCASLRSVCVSCTFNCPNKAASGHFDFDTRPCAHCTCKDYKIADCNCGFEVLVKKAGLV